MLPGPRAEPCRFPNFSTGRAGIHHARRECKPNAGTVPSRAQGSTETLGRSVLASGFVRYRLTDSYHRIARGWGLVGLAHEMYRTQLFSFSSLLFLFFLSFLVPFSFHKLLLSCTWRFFIVASACPIVASVSSIAASSPWLRMEEDFLRSILGFLGSSLLRRG